MKTLRLIQVIGGNSLLCELPGQVRGIPVGLHLYQVNNSLKVLFGSQRYLHGNAPGSEGFFHVVDGPEEVGPFTVHLADKGNSRYLELVGPLPDLFSLDLDTGDGGKNDHSAVKGSHAGAGVSNEISVTGGIDNVDRIAVPFAMVKGRGDGYLALDLLRLEVHGRGSVVNPTQAVDHPGVKEDRFGQ